MLAVPFLHQKYYQINFSLVILLVSLTGDQENTYIELATIVATYTITRKNGNVLHYLIKKCFNCVVTSVYVARHVN